MRLKSKTSLLASLVGCAVAAIPASAALATTQPEFAAESGSPIGTAITMKSGKVTMIRGNVVITCNSSETAGTTNAITGTAALNVMILFKECTWKSGSGTSCRIHTPGQASGSVETSLLAGELGPLASGKAGILLSPPKATAFVVYEGEGCGPGNTQVIKDVIGEVAPVNVFSESGTLSFTETNEKQTFRRFTPELTIEEPLHELQSGGASVRLVMSGNLAFSKRIEVRR